MVAKCLEAIVVFPHAPDEADTNFRKNKRYESSGWQP